MRRVRTGYLFATLFIVAGAAAPVVDVFERFDGTIDLRGPKDSTVPARVQIQNWLIPNAQTVSSFPLSGLLVMELRGGDLTTVIDGGRVHRETGAFWVVPAGASFTLITGTDTASLQVTAVNDITKK